MRISNDVTIPKLPFPPPFQCPEQVCVLSCPVSYYDGSVCKDNLHAECTVQGETVAAHEDAQTAAEDETGEPDGPARARDEGEVVGKQSLVHVGIRHACGHVGSPAWDVDGHRVHPRERDLDAARGVGGGTAAEGERTTAGRRQGHRGTQKQRCIRSQ